VPLDVEVVREHVHWTAAAAAALRHGIQSLEDHLASCGADDAELRVHASAERDRAVDLRAQLLVGGRLVVCNVQDIDLVWGVTQLMRQLLDELQHTLERATSPPGEGPWSRWAARVTALAHHEVQRVVDLGDAPAGAIDAADLAEEVLAAHVRETNGGGVATSWDSLRRALRAALDDRLARLWDRTDELSLEAPADALAAEGNPIEEDPYAFTVPDEGPLRNQDLIGGDDPLNAARRDR
jgi:hypothetical protein